MCPNPSRNPHRRAIQRRYPPTGCTARSAHRLTTHVGRSRLGDREQEADVSSLPRRQTSLAVSSLRRMRAPPKRSRPPFDTSLRRASRANRSGRRPSGDAGFPRVFSVAGVGFEPATFGSWGLRMGSQYRCTPLILDGQCFCEKVCLLTSNTPCQGVSGRWASVWLQATGFDASEPGS